MRTLLSQFCEEFDVIVRALIQPASDTAAALEAASPEVTGKDLRPEFIDLALQLETLADKVAEQQAYVLIFGPLKSGKSTLMNALSASYVSEVSSLPAYPCMVFVSHSETREYTVTRYTGDTEVHRDPQSLHLAIHRAHGELAERLRQSEASFDPATDFPQAIRRIDFKLPAGELAESGAVLVDTPGLYSRMKFGYDRMTREFRDAAACAIFVVKPENLFLEQVFAEFTELLELFSRIFLVVNIDSTKRDLAADGSLKPSLEAENPLRIIEAFEDLAMSAPLKRAAEEGRLKIYPVDLLHAAAERLGNDSVQDAEASRTSFDAFRGDLTNYLNSTEYLLAFLGDSLRRSKSLLAELDGLAEHADIEKLRFEAESIRADLDRATTRQAALSSLAEHDWRGAFQQLEAQQAISAEDHAMRIEERTRGALKGAVDSWFRNDDSLHTFNRKVVAAALKGHQEELLVFLEKNLRDEVSKGSAGLALDGHIRQHLETAQLDLGEIGAAALGDLNLLGALLEPDPAIPTAAIPVKKRFWDWLLFRSQARVQKRLFGAAERPSELITKAEKERRIGKLGRTAMMRALDSSTSNFYARAIGHLRSALLSAYVDSATERTESTLTKKAAGVERRRLDLTRQDTEHQAVLGALDKLLDQAANADTAINTLSEEYGTKDPVQLTQPAPELDTIELKPYRAVPAVELPVSELPNSSHELLP